MNPTRKPEAKDSGPKPADHRSSAEIAALHRTHLFPNVANYYKEPIAVARASGMILTDEEGREYLDFFGGILTIGVGHCRPEINEAITRQIGRMGHVSSVYPTAVGVDLARRVADRTPIERPGGKAPKVFFLNSGTEADETAVLTARLFTGEDTVVALRHGYSGRSQLAMTLTGHAPWRHGPPAHNVIHSFSAYCYRCPLGLTYPACDLKCARDLEDKIRTETRGKVAALLAEPIQGVGGYITPPKEFFEVLVGIVRQHGGIFICDEVQTGWGRTGDRWCGIEHWGVTPEIVTFAKAIANGFPLAATVARADVADSFRGLTISTFGGNPVAMAASTATLDVMEREDTPANSARMGARLRGGLEELMKKYAVIGDVRGMGLMQALELVKDRSTKEPAPDLVGRIMEETKARGLLIGKGGLYGNVIRISPPMIVREAEIDRALGILDQAFGAISRA